MDDSNTPNPNPASSVLASTSPVSGINEPDVPVNTASSPETPPVGTPPATPIDSATMQGDSAPPSPIVTSTQTSDSAVSEAVVQSKPKSNKLKLFVIILLIVGLVTLLGFVVWKMFLSGGSLAGNKGEIVWWGLWEDEITVAPLIEEYQAKNPKVKITYIKQSSADYRERLANALSKGEGPDIFTIHNSWPLMFQGSLDILPSSVMTQEDYAKTFYPVIVTDMTTSKGIVGIPLGYDALTLYVNNDLFTSVNATAPKTWDDFRALALSLTSRDETQNVVISGAAMGNTANTDHWEEIVALMMLQNGVNLKKPSEDVRLASDSLAFYTLFADKDKIFNDRLPSSTTVFAEGKSALYFGPSWRAFEIQQINPNLKFSTLPVPQLPKNDPNEPDVAYATYWTMSVSANSINKKTSWDFLAFLSSKESLEKLYTNASKTRTFGQAYPRPDMADLLKDHPILGSIIEFAPSAKSWYLADRTFDGATGLNTQVGDYYLDAVNAANGSAVGKEKLTTVEKGITQTISSFSVPKK